MNNELTHSIMQAYWAVGDYGGAARYRGMPESDIPLLVGCEIAQKISSDFNRSDYVYSHLEEAAEPINAQIRKHTNALLGSEEEVLQALTTFISHVDQKYRAEHRSYRWEMFIEWLQKYAFKVECQQALHLPNILKT